MTGTNLPAAGTDTLDTIAGQVKACLSKAQAANHKADDLRVTAGQLLAEARRRVDAGEAGPVGWKMWCKLKLPLRSYRDVQRLLAIARAPDPEAAATIERSAARLSMASSRKGDKRLSPPAAPALINIARGRERAYVCPVVAVTAREFVDDHKDAVAVNAILQYRIEWLLKQIGREVVWPHLDVKVGGCGSNNYVIVADGEPRFADDPPAEKEPPPPAPAAERFPKPEKDDMPCHATHGKCRYGGCQDAGACRAPANVTIDHGR